MKNKNSSPYWILYVGDAGKYERAYGEKRAPRALVGIRLPEQMGSEARDYAAGLHWEPLQALPPRNAVWDPEALEFRPRRMPALGGPVVEALDRVEEAEAERRAAAGEESKQTLVGRLTEWFRRETH